MCIRDSSYGVIKKELFEILWETFRGPRLEREKLLKDDGYLRCILAEGARKARAAGTPTIEDVRKKVGVRY